MDGVLFTHVSFTGTGSDDNFQIGDAATNVA